MMPEVNPGDALEIMLVAPFHISRVVHVRNSLRKISVFNEFIMQIGSSLVPPDWAAHIERGLPVATSTRPSTPVLKSTASHDLMDLLTGHDLTKAHINVLVESAVKFQMERHSGHFNVHAAFFKLAEPACRAASLDVILKSSFRTKLLPLYGPDLIDIISQLILTCTESNNDNPMSREGAGVSDAQNLLMQQDAVHLLYTMACVPYKSISCGGLAIPLWAVQKKGLLDTFLKMCRLAFRLLKQMCRQNGPIKVILADFIPDMSPLLGGVLQIANTMREVYDDNRELLYAVSDELVQDLVDLMKEGRYPRFMEFLYVFCECNDNPIPANQNRIARILFVENGHILLPVVVGAKDITIDESIMVGLLGDIDVLMLLETTVLSVDQLHFRFYIESLKCMRALCLGRNTKCVDVLLLSAERLGITYQDLLAIISSPQIAPVIKETSCQLMAALYLDHEPNEAKPPIQLTHIWADLQVDHIFANTSNNFASQEEPYQYCKHLMPTPGLTDLKDAIFNFFCELHPAPTGQARPPQSWQAWFCHGHGRMPALIVRIRVL